MIPGLKINTAMMICFAFIFRLLFVSAGTVSSINAHTAAAKKNIAIALKNRKTQIDPVENTTTPKYSAVEISEEDSDDEVQHKISTPLLMQFNFSVADNIRTLIQPISPFSKYYTCNSVQRHVEFRVFRI